MGFGGISGNWLPRNVHTFSQAKALYERIKPVRGKDDIRPVAKRREHHKRIIKGNDERGEYYALVLYQTECVAYYANGLKRLRSGGHYSTSTCTFLTETVPWIGTVSMDGTHAKHLVVTKGDQKYKLASVLWFDADDNPINPEPFTVHTIDKEAMKQVRAQYKPFEKFALAMLKMTDYRVEANVSYGQAAQTRYQLIRYCESTCDGMLESEQDRWADTFNSLALASSERTGRHNPGTNTWEAFTRVIPTRFKALIRDLVIYQYAPTVLKRITLPIGVHKRDTNIKYVK